MKKHKRIQARRNRQKEKFKKCPVAGGYCFNPMCAFGCIEKW